MASHTRNPGAGGTEASANSVPSRKAVAEIAQRQSGNQAQRTGSSVPARVSGSVPSARLPEVEESELLERDIGTIIEILTALRVATMRYGDTSSFKEVIERARWWADHHGFEKMAEDIDKLDRPATRDDISTQIMRLLGSMITARSDLEIRAKEMAGDVGAQAPGWFALDIACRKLRRTSKFPPVISEVLEALQSATNKIDHAKLALARTPAEIEYAAGVLQDRLDHEAHMDRKASERRAERLASCQRRLEEGKRVDCVDPDVLKEVMGR
jgi:hypothetical protein